MADYDQAIAVYTHSAGNFVRYPKLALAYLNRGTIYADQKNYDLAIADYDKAIDLDENMASAYQRRGDAFYAEDYAKRDVNRAKEDWQLSEYLGKKQKLRSKE